MPIQHRMDGADRRTRDLRIALLQALANLRRAPARILALQLDDKLLNHQRELIGVPVRSPAPIGEV